LVDFELVAKSAEGGANRKPCAPKFIQRRRKCRQGICRVSRFAQQMTNDERQMTTTNDHNTTLAELRELVRQFVAARDWQQFHTPKNLSMSLAIEAAELMEHFQWLTPEQSRAIAGKPDRLAQVGEELADVVCYALALANELDLDVASTLRDKMVKNEHKYPADEFRGKFEAG
jgi:NTP pyrophosphatase (non-canonical NTP hydrolase)